MNKPCYYNFVVIFHFVLEPFQPHFFLVGFSQKKEGEKDFGNLFAF